MDYEERNTLLQISLGKIVAAVTTESIYVEESATLIPSFTAAMIHGIVRPLSSSRGHMVS